MIKILKLIVINILFFSSFIIIIEILTGYLFKSKIDCTYLICNANLEYSIQLDSKIPVYVKYQKDEFGLRGRKNPDSQIDVLVVGGSTTDQRYLNLQETWVQLVEDKFNNEGILLDFVSAGIDGQSTVGHIWNFNNWFNKIKNFKPKYIIFYIGINEQENSAGIYDRKINSELNFFKKIKHYIKLNNGIFFRFYFKQKNLKGVKLVNVFHNPSRKKKLDFKEITIQKENTYNSLTKNLLNNLEVLLNLSEELGTIPIFITQRTLRWKNIKNRFFTYDGFDYYSKEKAITKTIIEYCEQKCIYIDIFNNLKILEEDTYDLIHLNSSGSKKLADLIYMDLKKIIN